MTSTWTDHAICAQTDPEIFFPAPGCPATQAKLMCSRCPVRSDCLNHAITHGEATGIWGGLSQRERHQLQKAG